MIKGGARLDGGFRYGTGRCLNLRFTSVRFGAISDRSVVDVHINITFVARARQMMMMMMMMMPSLWPFCFERPSTYQASLFLTPILQIMWSL